MKNWSNLHLKMNHCCISFKRKAKALNIYSKIWYNYCNWIIRYRNSSFLMVKIRWQVLRYSIHYKTSFALHKTNWTNKIQNAILESHNLQNNLRETEQSLILINNYYPQIVIHKLQTQCNLTYKENKKFHH